MRKQWSDLNRVMRNPAPPLPDSARAIKEQCIALMDETWGPIPQLNASQIFDTSWTGIASATGSIIPLSYGSTSKP